MLRHVIYEYYCQAYNHLSLGIIISYYYIRKLDLNIHTEVLSIGIFTIRYY